MEESKHDHKKFTVSELFNNKNGQTAIALVAGWMVTSFGILCFSWCVISGKVEMAEICVKVLSIGAGIFVGRNIKDAFKREG